MKNLEYTIVKEEGVRLENWLLYHWPAMPYGEALKALRKGFVRVDGNKVKHGYRLSMGNQVTLDGRWIHAITLTLPNNQKSSDPSKNQKNLSPVWLNRIQSWVLYEDDDLIVLNKPRGMACQGGTKQLTSIDALLSERQQTLGSMGKIHLLHRLDRDTTGVLLVGKNLSTARYIGELLASSSVKKVYWGVVAGIPSVPTGSINVPLTSIDSNVRQKMTTCPPLGEYSKSGEPDSIHRKKTSSPQHAVTHYRVVHSEVIEGKTYSLLCLMPETGRTHQIRVHLAHNGWPLVGDRLYGETWDARTSQVPSTKSPLQLHCGTMSFPKGPLSCKTSNVSKGILLFSAPAPKDFMLAKSIESF